MEIPISGTPESRKQAEEKHTGLKAHKCSLAKYKIRKNTKIVLLEQKEGTFSTCSRHISTFLLAMGFTLCFPSVLFL